MAAKKTKLVGKGILLYTTIVVYLVSAMWIDIIHEKGYLLIDIVICAVLMYACYKIISEEEADTLTNKHIYKGIEDDV